MPLRIGTAPDSWGVWFPSDPKQTPWRRFLDEVVQAGFSAIELGPYGYLPSDPQVLRDELEGRGLQLTAAFVMRDLQAPDAWAALADELTRICDLLATFGARHLVLLNGLYTDIYSGEPIGPRALGGEGWKRMLDTAQRIGVFTRDRDIRAIFHPHADTPVEYEDQIERFLADTDPAVMSLCLDVGHHAYRGGNAPAFLRRHHARIPYLHLKNVDPDVRSRVKKEGIPFARAVRMDMFTELSKGAVDLLALRDVLREIGFDGWGIVEQDMYPAAFDKPLPIAERNRAYLRQIEIG